MSVGRSLLPAVGARRVQISGRDEGTAVTLLQPRRVQHVYPTTAGTERGVFL